jgi:hypothetical protein
MTERGERLTGRHRLETVGALDRKAGVGKVEDVHDGAD